MKAVSGLISAFLFLFRISAASVDEEFKSWFIKNGGIISNIDIKEFRDMGKGLTCTSDLKAGDPVIFVPKNLIFSISNMENSPDPIVLELFKRYKAEAGNNLFSDSAIKAWLLLEKTRGASSFFQPYFNILPKYIPSLIQFSVSELDELQNSELAIEMDEVKNALSEEYIRFQRICPKLFPHCEISMEDYLWATSITDSRGLRFRGELNLAPMADIFNYAPHPEIRKSNSGEFFLKHHVFTSIKKVQGDDSNDLPELQIAGLQIFADRFAKKDSQLFEDYGDNSDDIYLKYHGFVSDLNPFRCVKIDAGKLFADHANNTGHKFLSEYPSRPVITPLKAEIIKEMQFKSPPWRCADSMSGELNRGINSYITILAFTKKEAKNCAAILKSQKKRDWGYIFKACGFDATDHHLRSLFLQTQPVEADDSKNADALHCEAALDGKRLTDRALLILQQIIFFSISQYPTNIKEDMEMLSVFKYGNSAGFLKLSDGDFHVVNPTNHSAVHRELAIRYRMHAKMLWTILANRYCVSDFVVRSFPRRLLVSAGFSSSTSKLHNIEITPEDNSDSSSTSGDKLITTPVDGDPEDHNMASQSSPGSRQKQSVAQDQEEMIQLQRLRTYFDITRGSAKDLLIHKSLLIDTVTTSTPEMSSECDTSSCMIDPSTAVQKKNPTTPNQNNEVSQELVEKLKRFNDWFQESEPFPGNKISAEWLGVTVSGNVNYRIGTVVKQPIDLDQRYLGVSTSIIMDSDTALNGSHSHVQSLIQSLLTRYNNKREDFHELAFMLMQEMFVERNSSFYWPYISLLPTISELDIPLLWTKEQIKSRLGPSKVRDMALKYQEKTFNSYNMIKKIDLITNFFAEDVLVYRNYQWVTAILDSRSIWWSGKRHLVPMLDFINCKEDINNPNRLHSTILDDTGKYAVTNSAAVYQPGEQLFENYGQPNHIYFLYHGFSLWNASVNVLHDSNEADKLFRSSKHNTHDCVQIDLEMTAEEVSSIDWEKAKNIAHRLGISATRPSPYTVCLTYPVPASVWVYLSLKKNNFMEQVEHKKLGMPLPSTIKMLVATIDGYITKYVNFLETPPSRTHIPSRQFIESELYMLRHVWDHLEEDSKIFDSSKDEL